MKSVDEIGQSESSGTTHQRHLEWQMVVSRGPDQSEAQFLIPSPQIRMLRNDPDADLLELCLPCPCKNVEHQLLSKTFAAIGGQHRQPLELTGGSFRARHSNARADAPAIADDEEAGTAREHLQNPFRRAERRVIRAIGRGYREPVSHLLKRLPDDLSQRCGVSFSGLING